MFDLWCKNPVAPVLQQEIITVFIEDLTSFSYLKLFPNM